MQVKPVHQFNNLGTQLLIGLFVLFAERAILVQGGRNPAVLHLAELREVGRDAFQRGQNLIFQGRFHRRQRHVGLIVVIIIVVAGNRVAVGIQFRTFVLGGFGSLHVRSIDNRFLDIAVFVHLVAKRGFQIDDVAQQNVFGQKFVMPDGDRLKGQRAFAEPGDHGVPTGLDPLGDGNLALAAQQFDRTHLAQIHADRVVSAVQFFGGGTGQRNLTRAFGGDQFGRALVLFFLGLFIFDDVDAHLGQHGHHVLDLFRADLIRRQNLIKLVVGDIAFLAGLGDHLLDLGLAHVQRNFLFLLVGFAVFVGILGGHSMLLQGWVIRQSRIISASN